MKFHNILLAAFLAASPSIKALDHHGITHPDSDSSRFILIKNNVPAKILIDDSEDSAVRIAAANLSKDFGRVCGIDAIITPVSPNVGRPIIAATFGSKTASSIIKNCKLDEKDLKGKKEKYVMTTLSNPLPGVDEALVILGSDRRGTVYGIYELSEQIGVSPWYDWADVPVVPQKNLSIEKGCYTAGSPAVEYRGIFLNDEAPCLTSWVKNTYGTDYGDHRFYSRVFELILRLRGNFMWPAMWGWAFYADDPLNSKTAQEMGIIMGTSHHEPMARNHQEWARKRKDYGKWNYSSNKDVINRFFTEGIKRMNGSEDVVTIGMRGDGDEAMSDKTDTQLLSEIIDSQRKIIKKVTGKKPEETPQVWALYKEVLDYYDDGLRAPDDVTYLLCDDNWGNIRRLPDEKERKHPGGWGMYYHVDYVGAPRNSKWINNSPIQNMWEQMNLTYDYGVDKLWVLNVGDLKPMEYPISQFLDLAWNPKRYDASNILDHTRAFCAQQFGKEQADEAARILNLYTKYNGRVTAEMLDRNTYNLNSGEWKQVADEYARLEAEALRQFIDLKPEYRDAYRQIILYPVQAMANLYEMYYAQAMNHMLHANHDPEANKWADVVERCFARDRRLQHKYNKEMSNGKWDGMMTQKHIGYTEWHDNFPADTMPEIRRIDETSPGGYIFTADNGMVIMDAEHFFRKSEGDKTSWTIYPFMGRTRSGLALTQYAEQPAGEKISYRFSGKEIPDSVNVHVIVKSTLAFSNPDGHRYIVAIGDGGNKTVNFNKDLNEKPENIYSVFYPTVARRVVENTVALKTPSSRNDGEIELSLIPLDPGIVFEKIIVDWGGYKPSYLFGKESKHVKTGKISH